MKKQPVLARRLEREMRMKRPNRAWAFECGEKRAESIEMPEFNQGAIENPRGMVVFQKQIRKNR